MRPRTILRTIILSGLSASLLVLTARAQERPHRDRTEPARASEQVPNWTGGYIGLHSGYVSTGGQTRGGRAPADGVDRFPPERTRVRP